MYRKILSQTIEYYNYKNDFPFCESKKILCSFSFPEMPVSWDSKAWPEWPEAWRLPRPFFFINLNLSPVVSLPISVSFVNVILPSKRDPLSVIINIKVSVPHTWVTDLVPRWIYQNKWMLWEMWTTGQLTFLSDRLNLVYSPVFQAFTIDTFPGFSHHLQ